MQRQIRSRPLSGRCGGGSGGLLSTAGAVRLRSSIRGRSVLREAALFLVRGPSERMGESGDGGPPVLSGFLSGSVCLPLALPLAPDLVDTDIVCYCCSPLGRQLELVAEEAREMLLSLSNSSLLCDVGDDCPLFRLEVSGRDRAACSGHNWAAASGWVEPQVSSEQTEGAPPGECKTQETGQAPDESFWRSTANVKCVLYRKKPSGVQRSDGEKRRETQDRLPRRM